jgi:PAS domain S-box-containing protein
MATRKITGMPWFMVAMIDQEEVLAPLLNEAWNVGIITALLLLASMLGIGLLWRQQKLADGRTNETRLQMLIEQAPLAINISREGKTVYANQKFLNFYGYKSFEELVGRPIFIYWAPEFRELIKERVRKRAQSGPVPSEYNGMAQRKDGSQFPVEIAVASVELPDGHADLAFIADITERQRAEQSLKLFRALIDHANDSIEVIDPDTGRFLDVNERGLRLHGYSREEYLALTVPQIDPRFDPATGKKVWQAHSENLKRIGFAVFETEHRRKDGSVFPVEVNANYVRLERDYILAVVRDITERKQAEKALLETKEQLQYIVNNTRDVIFQIDLNGNYIYGNSAAEQLTGYPLPQLLKMNMMQLVAPEYHALVKERLQQRLAGKVGEAAFKFEILHKDGHRIWTEQTTSEVRDSENKLVAIQGVARNITEQKKAEAALQFSEEKFSKAFQLSPDAMSISDLETGKYIEINDAHAKIFGYSKAEIIGHTACELKIVPGTIHDQTTETLRGQNSLHGLAIRLHNRKGESLEVMHSAEIIELGGRKCVLRVSRDVTKQRKLEEQFRQSQKMEAIGQLAGGVAHDFNNILAVIQMQSGLLRASENLSREQSELTDEIGHASQRAAALTRQLLLFSRKETAQKRDLDLNTAVNSMTKMLRRVISAEVQVQFKFAMEALFVHADPGMLDQVLMNLVVNARDAMPGGGKIVIETSSVEIDELSLANSQQAQTGSFVCLGVSDTGTGIPPEMLPKIFEPFFTTKKLGMGTGLGLATVFGIVQQHQGWVNVYSEIGQGSTFRVYLPRIVKTAEPQAEHPAFNTARGGKETILVVEDNAALSAAVCKTLWHLGYQVLAAASGPEALLIWKDKRDGIDLLLTDLVMPGGMNGKELAVQLLKEKPELKVIYASGYSAEVAGNDFPLEEGVNFLSKPFPALKLATTIRNILDKKTFLG